MVTGPAGPEPAVRIRISDTTVARVAAHRASRVPGVLALQADLGQALLGVAGSVPGRLLGPQALRPPPTGASAEVREGAVTVRLTVVTHLGYNCRDLAQAVQRAVTDEVAGYTGLSATVVVTVADIVISDEAAARPG